MQFFTIHNNNPAITICIIIICNNTSTTVKIQRNRLSLSFFSACLCYFSLYLFLYYMSSFFLSAEVHNHSFEGPVFVPLSMAPARICTNICTYMDMLSIKQLTARHI